MFYYFNDEIQIILISEKPPKNMTGLREITEEEYNQLIE